MKKNIIIVTLIITVLILPSLLFAIETAPRISDREIVERLTRLEEGQRNLERRIDNLDKGLNNRIDDLRSEINSRFNTLQWMLGLFITIALVILGFVLRMQWQMNRRQSRMETMLETHKDEIAFLKDLIEKLLPPKGVL
ncbi:MAG: hypothetical protein IMF19_14590 [Proteobacteria bacterium]|jgi:predicted PurR-regulated permease PerM|nr:hypothetical protein [Pseudomonadota bacterium]